MKKLRLPLAIALAASAVPAMASDAISGGFWVNHALYNTEAEEVTYGDTNYEALILYIDHADEASGWKFSSEFRLGKGAFTDPANNNTGGHYGFHKAWIGKDFEAGSVKIGKSQVPFGWKTTNFWPGDELLGGYADQMDVGVKWSSDVSKFHYDVAYYHVDDFGNSTETMDDGGHWGTTAEYQKGQTFVLNGSYEVADGHKVGASYQVGKLRDLAGNADRPMEGDHSAAVAYYEGSFGAVGLKAQYVITERDLSGLAAFAGTALDDTKIKNDRRAVTVTYALNDFLFYVDYTNAESKTDDYKDTVGSADSWAPGFSYDYGPGWFYLEYVSNDGGIDSNGMVFNKEDDYLYLTVDYYF
ncbi:MAG: hypothetical protein CMI13_14110 [Oleibacter sp.]|nr:hypothetical protein [Thalassolituus sp.]|tara:strand:+ start:226 stop:1296 length:1071 start_codon:yes stop_codon:yes gene_type:complete